MIARHPRFAYWPKEQGAESGALAAHPAQDDDGRLGVLVDAHDQVPHCPAQLKRANNDRGVLVNVVGLRKGAVTNELEGDNESPVQGTPGGVLGLSWERSERRCITARAGRSTFAGVGDYRLTEKKRRGTLAADRLLVFSPWLARGRGRPTAAREEDTPGPPARSRTRSRSHSDPMRGATGGAALRHRFQAFPNGPMTREPRLFLRLGGVLASHPVRRFPLCPSAGARNL